MEMGDGGREGLSPQEPVNLELVDLGFLVPERLPGGTEDGGGSLNPDTSKDDAACRHPQREQKTANTPSTSIPAPTNTQTAAGSSGTVGARSIRACGRPLLCQVGGREKRCLMKRVVGSENVHFGIRKDLTVSRPGSDSFTGAIEQYSEKIECLLL